MKLRYWVTVIVIMTLNIQEGVATESCTHPMTGTVSYSRVRDLITQCRLTNVNQLLMLLPTDYRSRFTLVHSSRSPEGRSVSTQFPRGILFGADARLLIAFTGDPGRPDFQTIQMIQYREGGHFDLHEITFSRGAAHIQNNPRSCTECHGQDPHPIWESYPVWPGVFGGFDDRLDSSTPEGQGFLAFRRSLRPGDRYSALVFPPGPSNEFSPYSGPHHFGAQPNATLTEQLLRLNGERVGRLLGPTHRVDSNSLCIYAALAGELNRCGPIVPSQCDAVIQRLHTLGMQKDNELASIAERQRIQRQTLFESIHGNLPTRDPILRDFEFNFRSDSFVRQNFSRILTAAELLHVPSEEFLLTFEGGGTRMMGPNDNSGGGSSVFLTSIGRVLERQLSQVYHQRIQNCNFTPLFRLGIPNIGSESDNNPSAH